MTHFTSNTYQMKREILNFSNKISRRLPRPDRKFTADMTYGILVSGNCLLTDIVDQLHEDSKKVNRGYEDNKMFLKLDELGAGLCDPPYRKT